MTCELLRGERVLLRPLRADDVAALLAIRAAPAVREWWGDPESDFPLHDDPAAFRYAVEEAGRVIGMIQFGEETEPDYRHAWIDLFIDPVRRGLGLGTEAVVMLADHLVAARGHHRITIDPAADNAAAIRSYEKAGFQRIGVMRARWYDHLERRWRDTLFMERVEDDPGPPPAAGDLTAGADRALSG